MTNVSCLSYSAEIENFYSTEKDDGNWIEIVPRHKKNAQISSKTAYNLQKKLGVTGLADVLLSAESINLQEDGWKFYKVLKNTDKPENIPEDTNENKYTWLPVQNKWADKIIYLKKIC